jgi:hypothetical protein
MSLPARTHIRTDVSSHDVVEDVKTIRERMQEISDRVPDGPMFVQLTDPDGNECILRVNAIVAIEGLR